jgi:hypothetical protein
VIQGRGSGVGDGVGVCRVRGRGAGWALGWHWGGGKAGSLVMGEVLEEVSLGREVCKCVV